MIIPALIIGGTIILVVGTFVIDFVADLVHFVRTGTHRYE